MLPATVILTNWLINSSEAKDNPQGYATIPTYMGGYERNIESAHRC